jgi:hypothetical protein
MGRVLTEVLKVEAVIAHIRILYQCTYESGIALYQMCLESIYVLETNRIY